MGQVEILFLALIIILALVVGYAIAYLHDRNAIGNLMDAYNQQTDVCRQQEEEINGLIELLNAQENEFGELKKKDNNTQKLVELILLEQNKKKESE